MTTYVAFLRAINATGRFVKMQTLASAFHSLGYDDARTYINSGNVIFSSSAGSREKLVRMLEEGLEPLLGFRTEAFVRSTSEVKAIAEKGAALCSQGPEGCEVSVAFLPATATSEQAKIIRILKSEIDSFEVLDQEIYWICLERQSNTKFSNAVLERKLGTRSTLRTGRMLSGLAGRL